jgi:TonB family protein
MMPTFQDALLAVSRSLALSTLVKATFAMLLGLGVVGLAGRARAAMRHAVLAATFGVLLGLPLVAAIAPPLRIAMRLATIAVPPSPNGTKFVPLPVVTARQAAVAPGASATSGVDWWLVVWMAGAGGFLVPVIVGLRQVSRLRRSGMPWRDGQAVVDGLARRRVDALLHEALPGPMTCGVARPAIVLPVDAPNWQRADLERAIVHELEHVRRGDWAIHCVARAVCAMYWFHPLVWIAWRRLELEAERSCDDAVLGRSEATAYADQLVAIAQRLSSAGKPPLLAMASRADLSARVKAVLDGGQRRGRIGGWRLAAVAVGAMALAGTVSPLRVVAAPQANATSNAMFRAETMLVVTPVTVTSASGAAVQGLAASEFTLTEDGVPQTIVLFEGGDPYVIGYYPRNTRGDMQFRKIAIAVKTATAATVNYRPGYTAGPSSAMGVEVPAGDATPGVQPPSLLYKKGAAYPDEARRAKYQGSVILAVVVDASGKVDQVRVQRSLGLGLDESAIEAVKQWRFKPASQDGKFVGTQVWVQVSYRLL